LSNIEGEFTSNLKFDGELFWEHSQYSYPQLLRMGYTLPSDSTFREDLIYLKKGDEEMAQKFKVKLEEIQRKDKRMREENSEMNNKKKK
jgi:hypothetical protein